jgi:hypothetical protein
VGHRRGSSELPLEKVSPALEAVRRPCRDPARCLGGRGRDFSSLTVLSGAIGEWLWPQFQHFSLK